LDELEIVGTIRDKGGTISHYGVKGYGIQNVGLIEKLIIEEACSFFVSDGDLKKKVFVRTSSNGRIFLTTDPNGYEMNTLDFLPLLDKPFLKRLIEPSR
jgi:hypothetical protein